jgi:hypothetical protein
MARRNGPELYELLTRAKDAGREGIGSSSNAAASTVRASGPTFDRRQLAGILALAAMVVVAVGAYLAGVSRGERIGRAALAAERAEELRLLEEGRPAVRGATSGAERPGSPTVPGAPNGSASAVPAADRDPMSENAESASDGAPTVPSIATPTDLAAERGTERDPRLAGLNYFVIASGVLEERVPEILSFCRSKGLDAWVVPDQNGRLREITVLPGFEAGRRSAPEIKDLEAKIRRVGVLWKAAGRNNQDFAGAYPKRFGG